MTLPVRRLWGLLAAMLVLTATTPALPAAAAPQGQYAGTLRFQVDSITPALVTATTSNVTIRGSMTNTGSEELTGVVARWQRGEAFTSTDAVRTEIGDPSQAESVLTGFTPVTDTIPAGAAVGFTVQTGAFDAPRSGLGIDAAGVYPVMINVNASFASGPDNGARVGELHTLLTVASVPDGAPTTGTRQAVSMVMPLVDRPHRDPTGAFFDDDLAALIATGGRLEDVLSAAEAPGLPSGAVTLAVDPELLEELSVMAAGYTVGPYTVDLQAAATTATFTTGTTAGATDPVPTTGSGPPDTPSVPATATTDAVPTTTGSAVPLVPDPSSVPGTGTDAAREFLERLRALTASTPVLVLPYTDLDVVAAVRAGHADDVAAAGTRGRELATEILGPQARLVTDVSWPIDGLTDPAALTAVRSAGQTSVVLDRAGVADAAGDQVSIGTDAGTVTAVLASSSVPDSPVDLDQFTALTAQRWLSGDRATTVIAPARSWQPDRGDFASITVLLRELGRAGLVEGVPIDQIAARAADGDPPAATLAYPEDAVARELPGSLFQRIDQLADAMRSTQAAFTALPTEDPATTAPTDLFADVEGGLARQAAGGYRIDPGAANRSNAAVETVVTAVQAGVTITPTTSVFRLTSSTSPLLVTLLNTLPYTAHVRIRVDSTDAARAGITVSDVGLQTVPAGRRVQVLLPTEVSRAGSSTLRVWLTGPDGAAWGPQQKLEIRSTAIGSFTVVIVVAAAAVVLLTTGLRIRKRYRQRRERIAAGLQ